MPRMLTSSRMDALTTLALLGVFAVSFWKPEMHWPIYIALAVMMLSLILRSWLDTDADRAARRKHAWVVPAATVAVAAQLVYSASADERSRSLLFAGGLVAAGFALFFLRRRTA